MSNTTSVVALAPQLQPLRAAMVRLRSTFLRSGAAYERARKELRRLEDEHYHPKNWRPSILAFSGTVTGRPRTAVFANWLCAGRGGVGPRANGGDPGDPG